MTSFDIQRARMVREHLVTRGVRDPRVLAAMGEVRRELFVPASAQAHAYDDGPLEIAAGQTISQPYIVAHMAEMAGIGPHDRVLEVGTGSGYAAAIFARLGRIVFTIERHAELHDGAVKALAAAGVENVRCRVGDGSLGWPEEAPFDAILVAAAGPRIPPSLLEQLAIGGRLVAPIGGPGAQRLERVVRLDATRYASEALTDVRFVPLVEAPG